MPKFSIIIPVYKVEAYLDQCIKSVVAQTYGDFEVILVDDGSPDNCPILCDAWAALDGRIKVIHKKNGGLSSARNAGISIALGDYILFLDSDDWWHDKEVLEKLSCRIDNTGADVISYNYHKTDGESHQPVYFQKKTDMPEILRGHESFGYQTENDLWIACAWNKALKRSLFEKGLLRFVDGIPFEDIDWCVRLAFIAKDFDYLNEDAVCYRYRPESISQSPTPEKVEILIKNTQMSFDVFEAAEDREKAELLKPYMGYQCATLIFTISRLDDKEKRRELLEKVRGFLPMISWSRNKRARIVYIASKLFGLKAASNLMYTFNKRKH